MNQKVLKTICEKELISRIRSLHAIYDQDSGKYQANMLIQLLSDRKWHWITDSYESTEEIKYIFEKSLELNWAAHPEDSEMLDKWSSEVALWLKNPTKGISLFQPEYP